MSTSFSKLEATAHFIKVKLIPSNDKFGGSSCIVKPESIKKAERNTAHEGIVLEIGPQAFQIFGDGDSRGLPRCKVGDHILFTKFNSIEQDDCNDDDDSLIRIILDENVIGPFRE